MRYVVARSDNGLVVNVVDWDGDVAKWNPPSDRIVVQSAVANIGDTWNGTTFVAGPPPSPSPDQIAYDAAVTQLRNTFSTARSAAQLNGSIDAITVVLRRIVQELRP